MSTRCIDDKFILTHASIMMHDSFRWVNANPTSVSPSGLDHVNESLLGSIQTEVISMKSELKEVKNDQKKPAPEKFHWVQHLRLGIGQVSISDLQHFFVSCYDIEDPKSPGPLKHGYQRNPDELRFRAIGRHYLERPADISPLLVSVRVVGDANIRRAADFLRRGAIKDLVQYFGSDVLSLVDGQHRRGGLLFLITEEPSKGELHVPVNFRFALSIEEEAELFNTINTTQRKLPKALMEVNRGDITERSDQSHAQRIRAIAFGIARDRDSVWFDQINMTGGRAPGLKVTYEGLRRSTANMFPSELLARLMQEDLDPLQDVGKVFWQNVAKYCSSAWKNEPSSRKVVDPDTGEESEEPINYRLRELVGVASLARLGRDLIGTALDGIEFGADFQKTLDKRMARLADVDWEKRQSNPWMSSQAGFAGQATLYRILYDKVYNGTEPSS